MRDAAGEVVPRNAVVHALERRLRRKAVVESLLHVLCGEGRVNVGQCASGRSAASLCPCATTKMGSQAHLQWLSAACASSRPPPQSGLPPPGPPAPCTTAGPAQRWHRGRFGPAHATLREPGKLQAAAAGPVANCPLPALSCLCLHLLRHRLLRSRLGIRGHHRARSPPAESGRTCCLYAARGQRGSQGEY